MRDQLTCVLICLGVHSTSLGDDILKSLRSRQPKVHSVQLKWTQEFVMVNAEDDSLLPGGVGAATCSFTLDTKKQRQWRLELETPQLTENGIRKSRRVSILDKNGELTEFCPVVGGSQRATASIGRQQSKLNQDLRFFPIALLYLPWNEDWNPKYVGQESIDGVLCRSYELQPTKESRVQKLWVMADTPHFRPIRFASFHQNGKVRYDFHLSTEVDERGVTQLKGWKSHLTSPSDLPDGLVVRERQAVKVTDLKVNKSVDAGQFQRPPFPHGTTVRDSIRGSNYVLRRTADGGEIQDTLAFYDAQFVLKPDPSSPSD